MDLLSPVRDIFALVASLSAIRVILGFMLVFFIPGFAWTLVFFKQVSVLERVALSFGLSIAIVTLSIFVLHTLLGIRINAFNAILIILMVTVIPLAFYCLNRLMRRHQDSPPETEID